MLSTMVIQRSWLVAGLLAVAAATTAGAQTPPTAPPPGPAVAPAAQAPPQRYQAPANGRKRILIVAQTMGWHHDSISDALATLVRLGQQSNLYDAEIRTDTEWLTKKPLNPMRKNLVQYDAVVFCLSLIHI